MAGAEPKKLALWRLAEILHDETDPDHPLKQEEMAALLESRYGIVLERKAISRNLSLLKEAGLEIESCREGSYLVRREFEDPELHLLIDGILSSRHVAANQSADLIERICRLSNRYFKANVKHIRSVNEWSKTDNQELFLNVELVDEAIGRSRQLHYQYNKFGADKKLHRSSEQYVSPYQMLLHNQHYYLMAYSEYWHNVVYHRLDRITDMTVTERPATPLRSLTGYKNGIDYKALATSMPYMYADKPETVVFLAADAIIDQIVDWFGQEANISAEKDGRVRVTVRVSPSAMHHWAMQYLDYVEVVSPFSLRDKIRASLTAGTAKYQ